VVTAGPHTGEEYFLGKGGSKKILFGTKPSTKAKDVDMISLPRATMEANHARLDFVGNKHCLKINVTNMSGGDTFLTLISKVGVQVDHQDRIRSSVNRFELSEKVGHGTFQCHCGDRQDKMFCSKTKK
jgi:hypothetical protein